MYRFSRVMGILSVFTSAFIASPSVNAAESEREFGPWVRGLAAGAVHQSDADLSDADGEFNVSRGFVQGSLGYAWDRRTSVSLSLGAGNSNYDFSSQATIGGQQPWDEIEDYRISLPVRFSPTENTDVILIPSVRTFRESGASLSEGRTEGFIGGMSWKLSDTLTIGPGMGWFSEIGGGSNAFPILVIDWDITDKLSLSTGRGLAASQGPGLTLDYQLAKKWKLGLAGRYEKTRFALNVDAPGSGEVGEDRSLPLVVSLDYTLWPMTSITAMIGAEFEGTLRLEDGNGSRIAQSDFDTAPIIGLSFSYRF
jgi:opacity protein-like surface antigen